MKEKTVCFSGHRPEKMPRQAKFVSYVKKTIALSIELSINEGYTCFMSGLARGIDTWAAMEVIKFKKKNPDIRLIAVKPFPNHFVNFSDNERSDIETILAYADRIVCTSPAYSEKAYAIRNRYMVEHSSKLIAFVNNYRSGTGQTIRFAKNLGLDITIVNLKDLKENYQQTLEKM